MKDYNEAVKAVKTIKETIAKTGVYDEKAIKCASSSMNGLLQEIYGIGVFEVEKDTEGRTMMK